VVFGFSRYRFCSSPGGREFLRSPSPREIEIADDFAKTERPRSLRPQATIQIQLSVIGIFLHDFRSPVNDIARLRAHHRHLTAAARISFV